MAQDDARTNHHLVEDDGVVDFHHPFTPYEVQLQFMRAVYNVLQQGEGQVGILESPTGTGKSLSLICSAITWLRNYKKSQYEVSINASKEAMKGEPDWMVDHTLRRRREELARKWEEREARLARIRESEKTKEERGNKRRRLEGPSSRAKEKTIDEEAEFLLDDWTENGEGVSGDSTSLFSKETRELMKKVGIGPNKKEDDPDAEAEDELKIYYTSRTHSQLSQFISELRRPLFPPSIPASIKGQNLGDSNDSQEGVKHIPLSSRQRLCINPGVARLGSLSAINDRCAELQQPKSKDRCAYIPNAENLSKTHQFRDTGLATLPDIEDMFHLGKALQVCPYYASRSAIPGAEIVTLPYPLLLQQSARDALGIKLEGNVVIIDEAHNIMDAVANVHAAEIRLSDLRKARQIVGVYVRRFGKKLKGENRVMVAQVVRLVDSLAEWLNDALGAKSDHGIVDSNLLLKAKGADQINLYNLLKYIQESKLAYKVESYASHVEDLESSAAQPKSSTPVLHTLASFVAALTNLSSEGRIFYEKIIGGPTPDIKLSYLLLSPTHAFSSIASSARAVILAGGTMSPFDDYKTHLFPYLQPGKINTLSCGHVIPPSNLCVWTLSAMRPTASGGGGGGGGGSITTKVPDDFEFSFQKRSNKGMIQQLGAAILNICTVVPDGIVVFFPSYGYLDEVASVWQAKDPAAGPDAKPLWDRLQAKKAVFRESKGGSSEEVLQEYSAAILGSDDGGRKKEEGGSSAFCGRPVRDKKAAASTQKGALLLSVVGGKMSEGINFSDRLGRCVVIVGLPYPNINSPEWKARIEYVESSTLARLKGGKQGDETAGTVPAAAVSASKQAARDFYENACMRAVNQSIGRAIRHQNDYASIILVDKRFGTERIRSKLPGWIRGGMVDGSERKGLQGLMGALSGFFRGIGDKN